MLFKQYLLFKPLMFKEEKGDAERLYLTSSFIEDAATAVGQEEERTWEVPIWVERWGL